MNRVFGRDLTAGFSTRVAMGAFHYVLITQSAMPCDDTESRKVAQDGGSMNAQSFADLVQSPAALIQLAK